MAAEHTERRALVTMLGPDRKPLKQRKRATVIDDIFGITDDGYLIHVPTGHNIDPPKHQGEYVKVTDDRAFALHMLKADPEGWASTRSFLIGVSFPRDLAERLLKTRDSYRDKTPEVA